MKPLVDGNFKHECKVEAEFNSDLSKCRLNYKSAAGCVGDHMTMLFSRNRTCRRSGLPLGHWFYNTISLNMMASKYNINQYFFFTSFCPHIVLEIDFEMLTFSLVLVVGSDHWLDFAGSSCSSSFWYSVHKKTIFVESYHCY